MGLCEWSPLDGGSVAQGHPSGRMIRCNSVMTRCNRVVASSGSGVASAQLLRILSTNPGHCLNRAANNHAVGTFVEVPKLSKSDSFGLPSDAAATQSVQLCGAHGRAGSGRAPATSSGRFDKPSRRGRRDRGH
jgi:hypothetical protein